LSKKDTVYDLVIKRLVDATYKFGEQILVKDLVAETQTSRQPVMSALNHLAADGFVRIAPQVGCQVINPSANAIQDFFLMFAQMEGLLARLAAERRTEKQIEALQSVQSDIEALRPDDRKRPQKFAALNQQFHGIIHEMANSSLVAERQRPNFNMSDFFIAQTVGFDRLAEDAKGEHRMLIEAIDKRDANTANDVAQQHILSVANKAAPDR
jgi:DNA-binding GntR family transcriptional regulator